MRVAGLLLRLSSDFPKQSTITEIFQNSQKTAESLAALPRETVTLSDLHNPIVENVNPRLPTQDQGRFARTDRHHHGIFKKGLRKQVIEKLLTHIVRGELAPTLQMLENDPSFLLARGTVTDYSGRSIANVTPFQAAWGGDDDEMCDAMLRFFDALPAQEGVKPTVSSTAAAAAPETKTATPTDSLSYRQFTQF